MHRLLNVMRERFALVVSLPKNVVKMAKAAEDSGADAIKVHLNVHHHASGTLFGPWDEEKAFITEILRSVKIPVGIVPGAETLPEPSEIDEIVRSGVDLVDLYAHHMPASYFLLEGVSRMVALDCSYPLWMAKHLEALGADIVEAAVVPHEGYGDVLSARDLALYRELAAHTTRPTLVPTQRRVTPGDVPLLKAAGARGVMIGAIVTELTVDGVARATASFRRAVDALNGRGE